MSKQHELQDNFNNEDQQLQFNGQSILSKREKIIENFLQELSSCVNFDNVETSTNGNNSNRESFDECEEQNLLYDMEKKLASVGILLSNKYGPILKQFMSQKQQQIFSNIYVRLPKGLQLNSEAAALNISVVYSKCFSNWIDSSCVSVQSPNKILLKNLLPKDCYILTFYSMACVKRIKFDECFALSIVGKSSCGKSRILEAVLQESSFSFNSEKGIGRYNGCKHRPILMYHDIDLSVLCKGTDGAIFRSLSRTEPTNVKVHSSLITLPPLWIIISSNQRVNSHTFEKNLDSVETKNKFVSNSFFSKGGCNSSNLDKYESQLTIVGSKRELLQESLVAVRMRVLELFLKAQPNLKSTPLPSGVMFTRVNLIVGVYNRIVYTMKKYNPDDFYSPVLISYVLTALCYNYNLYAKIWPDEDLEKVSIFDVASLIITYIVNVDQQNLFFKILDFVPQPPAN